MIAMTGCAKRNADRELARVLALLDDEIAEMDIAGSMSPGVTDAAISAVLVLEAFRRRLLAMQHRKAPGAPEPPSHPHEDLERSSPGG